MNGKEGDRRTRRAEELLKDFASKLPPETLFTPDEREALQRRLRTMEPNAAEDGTSTTGPPETDE